MNKILYHNISAEDAVSVFDQAIVSAAKGSHLKLASPYIGINYLRRIVGLSDNWKLVTDISAWLMSLTGDDRGKVVHFVKSNHGAIHHCDLLHAKAAIGQHSAYFGSANLTEKGILGRAEIGMFADESQSISELNRWFDAIWSETDVIDIFELEQFVKWLDLNKSKDSARNLPKITATNQKIKANFAATVSTHIEQPIFRAITPGNTIWRNPSEDKESDTSTTNATGERARRPQQEAVKRAAIIDAAKLDAIFAEVVQLVLENGNPLPLHTPWSVLQVVSLKTSTPWAQVSKVLTRPNATGGSLIDVDQSNSGCQINLQSIAAEQLALMPRTAALIAKI
ncbi:phospholipase D-like domain-containing protein [Variovorax sp. J31P179]|uniref:phospholipase D-like domain-containing protein n=1 Tax=Variovorax sp. J31P179 TaxID=3053508 RepID=UPI002575E567|nr:phospholipase D-like domain-containing protein [Variovorax sp. J31P179]MDM0079235.1 phospholipase D-like domain-containing protein [Variovorax sp. J31P179]